MAQIGEARKGAGSESSCSQGKLKYSILLIKKNKYSTLKRFVVFRSSKLIQVLDDNFFTFLSLKISTENQENVLFLT